MLFVDKLHFQVIITFHSQVQVQLDKIINFPIIALNFTQGPVSTLANLNRVFPLDMCFNPVDNCLFVSEDGNTILRLTQKGVVGRETVK